MLAEAEERCLRRRLQVDRGLGEVPRSRCGPALALLSLGSTGFPSALRCREPAVLSV